MINNSHNKQKSHRSGATVIEFLAAGALLATVMSFLAPFVSRVVLVNDSIAEREIALREVRAIIVQLQQGEPDPKVSDDVASQLDSAELYIEKQTLKNSSLEKLTVSMTWNNQYGEQHPPISLSFWQPVEEGAE